MALGWIARAAVGGGEGGGLPRRSATRGHFRLNSVERPLPPSGHLHQEATLSKGPLPTCRGGHSAESCSPGGSARISPAAIMPANSARSKRTWVHRAAASRT